MPLPPCSATSCSASWHNNANPLTPVKRMSGRYVRRQASVRLRRVEGEDRPPWLHLLPSRARVWTCRCKIGWSSPFPPQARLFLLAICRDGLLPSTNEPDKLINCQPVKFRSATRMRLTFLHPIHRLAIAVEINRPEPG